jgi:hypothetical protein
MTEPITLLTPIHETTGSHLGKQKKNCGDEGFFSFSTVPPGICEEVISQIRP